MSLLRLIARLDIKGPNLIKPIRFEGLRVVGDPAVYAKRYAEAGADELLFVDTVATLYGRNQLTELLERTTHDAFVPVTVAGGISSMGEAAALFNAGADKVALNTAAIREPSILCHLSDRLGCQAIVASIEAKKTPHGWEAYTHNGREKTGKDAVKWAVEAVERGAGELLVTSIDQEGTRAGFDLELIRTIAQRVEVPVTACGGMGSLVHLREAIGAGATGIASASALHYGLVTFEQMANVVKGEGNACRMC